MMVHDLGFRMFPGNRVLTKTNAALIMATYGPHGIRMHQLAPGRTNCGNERIHKASHVCSLSIGQHAGYAPNVEPAVNLDAETNCAVSLRHKFLPSPRLIDARFFASADLTG